MRQRDVELVRLSRTDGRIRLGVAAVVLLLIAAVVKPWPNRGSAGAAGTGQPFESSTGVTAAAPGSPSSPAAAPGLCVSPDGWRVVADDVELGRSVRTWMVADVEYSTITPPALSTIPVTTLVSSQVERLGFCLPVGGGTPGANGWSGTLWRTAGTGADPTQEQKAATLDPVPGSLGALAHPVGEAAITWAPGLYFLQADFAGSNREAWLGLLIRRDPN